MKALVLLPTYNESENLPKLVPEIFSHLPDSSSILVIDDHSPDGTGQIAEGLSKNDSRVSVLHRPGKMGLGSAYLAGFDYALKRDYDVIIMMDCDFSHSPSYLPLFLEQIKSCDYAVGSRYIPGGGVEGWGIHRLCLSRFANFYARTILGCGLSDLTGAYRCFKRKVIESLDLKSILSEGYAFMIELNYRALRGGFLIKEVPIVFLDRTRGKSKMSTRVIWESIFLVWKLRFLSAIGQNSGSRKAERYAVVWVVILTIHYYFFFLTNHYWADFGPAILSRFFK